MKIAITGEKGFIGTHLTHHFKYILKYEVIELGRDYLPELAKIKNLDWLIHGACIHRHEIAEEVLNINRNLSINTINCLKDNNLRVNIAFLSSIHEDADSYYGQSKRETKALLNDYCITSNKKFLSYKLPNIFGKYAVPHKISFVATFCYNLHHNLPITYNQNIVKLIDIKHVVSSIGNLKQVEINGINITVEEVFFLLTKFHKNNCDNIFPELKTDFELNLYQTFLDYKDYKLLNHAQINTKLI